jgi:uncharacterized protein YprB with RNaseH-like and TPR domain
MGILTFTAGKLKKLETVRRPARKVWNSDRLRILAFSDYRVQDISLLLEFVKNLRPGPDLILYAGDDIERFRADGENFFESLAGCATHGLCAVVGNDAEAEGRSKSRPISLLKEVTKARSYIGGENVYNVHCVPVIIGDYAVIGSEGSPPGKEFGALGTIVYPESSIARHLRSAAGAVKAKHLVVVSHTPPMGVLDFAIRFGTRHIGSAALRKFLRGRENVPLVVCGHVHYSGGQSKRVGLSTIVNAASHDDYGAPGRVALIELQAGRVVGVEWHTLWELCSITGIGPERQTRLKAAGIKNVIQLAQASEGQIAAAIRGGISEARALRARAQALLGNQIIRYSRLDVPRGRRAFIDVETHVRGEFVWLVGLHLEEENKTYAFYAETPKQEKEVLTDFLDCLRKKRVSGLLSYSGCRMEERTLAQRLAAHGLSIDIVHAIADIYFDIHGAVAFPIQGLKLKEVAHYCGFRRRHPDMDGLLAASIYGESGKLTKRKKRMLLEYNEDDVLAVKHLLHCIENLSDEHGSNVRNEPAYSLLPDSE